MRILFLSTWFPFPPDNGSKNRSYHLLRALTAQHDVTTLAFQAVATESPTFDEISVGVSSVIPVRDDPFRYVDAPSWKKYLSLSPLVYRASPAMRITAAQMSHQGVWDAVVAVQMPVAQYAQLVDAEARIIDVDTALTHQLYLRFVAQRQLVHCLRTWVSYQKTRRYERAMLRTFHSATIVSQVEASLLDEMVRQSACCVSLIPNGVDCTYNRPAPVPIDRDCLVFNGSLTYDANYDAMAWFLTEVYPLLRAARPEVSLTITGSFDKVDLANLPLDESIRLTGYVNDVRGHVAQAMIAIAPIRQGGGTRIKILEAMALGTPVVATTKGAEGLDALDGEHLLLADTPECFASAVIDLIGNADERARLARNARHLVEMRYDWHAIGEQFVKLVEKTVERQRGSTGCSAEDMC